MTTEWLIQYRYLDNLEDIYRRELFETATGPATTKMMTKHKSYDNVDVFFFNERQCDSDCDKENNDKDAADSGKSILCSSAITSWLKIFITTPVTKKDDGENNTDDWKGDLLLTCWPS